ncbi:DUF4177 domain-containing protein [Evansella cellulosilytica]|uniref:DUF4177 domain-containing protein n=1 Tax=Evansella cellulosilytica (strain ATCC 21833 / DSM 2522 / FERM P-1141 / JCM 9156 / N-4) TaxID=649639 RepID=E6TX84_EVAC2|nr:DUF4177 domain-containing protein [Evansella cellulosilytica]ADU32279.1 hypothetical protein Bcell_4049 [Evansella cellulosilytica DSM 2522]
MYEYKFVKIDLSSWNGKPKENYHDVIVNYAKDGWRFVQIFAPATTGYGHATYFELIFERSLH